jgi:hypothetical protein
LVNCFAGVKSALEILVNVWSRHHEGQILPHGDGMAFVFLLHRHPSLVSRRQSAASDILVLFHCRQGSGKVSLRDPFTLESGAQQL